MVALSVSADGVRRPTLALAALCAAALCAAVAMSPQDATGGPVVCPFRLVTGLPCPGCGLTRAWVFAAHGRLADSISANPFGLVTLPAALVLVIATVTGLVRRSPLPDLTRLSRHPLMAVVMVAWIGFAVVRAAAVATGHATI